MSAQEKSTSWTARLHACRAAASAIAARYRDPHAPRRGRAAPRGRSGRETDDIGALITSEVFETGEGCGHGSGCLA